MYDRMDNRLFETYKNSVMPHGHRIYVAVSDMVMANMCEYPTYQHEFPHRKFVLHCCTNFPRINITGQESDTHHSNTSTSISFQVYHLIARCTVNGIHPLDEKEIDFCVYKMWIL